MLLAAGDPLTIDMSFVSDQPLQGVHWEVCPPVWFRGRFPAHDRKSCNRLQVQYMVDLTVQRHILELGSTETTDYPAGKSSMHFATTGLDVAPLNKSWLNNVGLLLVLLTRW